MKEKEQKKKNIRYLQVKRLPRKKYVSELQLLKYLTCTKHSRYACVNVPSMEPESPVGGTVLILCC